MISSDKRWAPFQVQRIGQYTVSVTGSGNSILCIMGEVGGMIVASSKLAHDSGNWYEQAIFAARREFDGASTGSS